MCIDSIDNIVAVRKTSWLWVLINHIWNLACFCFACIPKILNCVFQMGHPGMPHYPPMGMHPMGQRPPNMPPVSHGMMPQMMPPMGGPQMGQVNGLLWFCYVYYFKMKQYYNFNLLKTFHRSLGIGTDSYQYSLPNLFFSLFLT